MIVRLQQVAGSILTPSVGDSERWQVFTLLLSLDGASNFNASMNRGANQKETI
jgi:hypothetical protein